MKHILGFSSGFHDGAVSLIDQRGDIVFAAHSERYSKVKNDANIHPALVAELYGYDVSDVAYYERPVVKQLRQLYAGQGWEWNKLTVGQIARQQLKPKLLSDVNMHGFNHHLCHAAAGFQTSPFDRATVVVIDAVGEFETITIWGAEYVDGRAKYTKLWQQNYPHSIGLFYTAVTERIGLKPMEDEYITMGMAAYGRDAWYYQFYDQYIQDPAEIRFKQNLHAGMDHNAFKHASDYDLAATAQSVAEDLIYSVMKRAAEFKYSNNLVYGGGVALNCAANAKLGQYFDNIWILPNPGDAGSSLGAASLVYGRRINFNSAFLGHDIPGAYPVDDILNELLVRKIVGVASGRAEFGPRALGNRSLLADPRGSTIKETVNEIKRRQQFRPFAPVILEELADTYFDMPRGWSNSRYMQSIARCRLPELFPAIIHHDGTSRVQTVPADGSGIRQLLEKWYAITDCPMLLNTSLNIKGEPMVNDRADADRFEQRYRVKVCS